MPKYLFAPLRVFIFLLILLLLNIYKPTISFASDPTGIWSSTTNLPVQLASHISFTSSNKISVIGGANTVVVPTNISSVINVDGSLLPWISSGPSLSLFWHSSAVKDKFLYVLGGATYPPTKSQNSVYLGIIDNSGIIPSWTSLTPLSTPSSLGAAAVVGNRIYFAGGFNEGNGPFVVYQNVYFAPINADGTIGSWTVAGLLPEAMDGFGMVEHENNLIIVGGRNAFNINLAKTYKTGLNADGTLIGWQETSSLPEAVHRSGVIRIGSTLLSIGGDNGGNFLDKIYYADINPDSTLGPWSLSSNHLPQPVCCAAVANSGNYIYLTGGFNGNYLNTVYFTQINSSSTLAVPYFSQNSMPWGPTEYDSAASLGISSPTMDRWGCAVTSAAMILKYHGMNEFANGDPMNPGNLNHWLDNNNGYQKKQGSSAIFWSSIQRLSKELFNAGKSNVKLVHSGHKPNANTTNLLNNDLTVAKIPHMLQVTTQWGSHYVVAKGVLNNGYSLNDPEWNYPDLSYFINNSYQYTHRYLPSQTNFSYIEFVVDPNVEVLVTDSQGRKTGKEIINGQTQEFIEIPIADYYFEPPIANPNEEDLAETLGLGVNRFLLPEPLDGQYTLLLTSTQSTNYSLEIHTLESDGDYITKTLTGTVSPIASDSYQIQYSQTSPSVVSVVITFQSTINDIQEAQDNNLITKDSLASNLIRIIEKAEDNVLDGRLILAQRRLEHFERTINRNRGDEITEDAYQILQNDINYLMEHL